MVLTSAIAATQACGGDGGTGPGGGGVEAGRFTARLSGSFTQTLSGPARYFQGGDALSIVLSDEAQGSGGIGVILARGNSSLPGVGEYRVIDGAQDVPEEDFIASSFWGSSGNLILCQSGDLSNPGGDGGTVSITASSSNVVGDFTTKVGCLDPSDGVVKAATITGEFNAEAGPPE